MEARQRGLIRSRADEALEFGAGRGDAGDAFGGTRSSCERRSLRTCRLRSTASRMVLERNQRRIHIPYALRTSMKACCGMCTEPMDFIRFLPSFCFSRSLRLRVISPP
jgi:hypothetical protein